MEQNGLSSKSRAEEIKGYEQDLSSCNHRMYSI